MPLRGDLRILKAFGDESKRIDVSVGAEQEYFLVDRKFYEERLDYLRKNSIWQLSS